MRLNLILPKVELNDFEYPKKVIVSRLVKCQGTGDSESDLEDFPYNYPTRLAKSRD